MLCQLRNLADIKEIIQTHGSVVRTDFEPHISTNNDKVIKQFHYIRHHPASH